MKQMTSAFFLVTILLSSRAFTQTAPTAPTPTPTPAPFTTVIQNDEKENLLADGFGRTLYIFDLDQGQAIPRCSGDCAELWPPYLVTDAEAKLLVAPLGSIVRANKKLQLTYSGHPVYTYGLDRTTGDDKGDGVGNVWHYIQL